MKKTLFDFLFRLLSNITSKKVVYISASYIRPTNLAVKSKYGFWYCGNVFDKADISYGIASNGDVESFDSNLVTKILRSLRRDYIFYDIGANTGWYSMLAASVSSDCSVFCFEPVAEHIECLKESSQLNQFQSRVFINPIALSDSSGKMPILLAGSGSSLEADFLSTHEGSRMVDVRTLDSIAQEKNIPAPDFIKMDIEGHEYKALLGAQNIVSKSSPILFIEIAKTLAGIHRDFIHKDYEKIFELLSSWGYVPFIAKDGILKKFDTTQREDGVYMFLFLHKTRHSYLLKDFQK